MQALPDRHPDKHKYLTNLGNALQARFRCLGDVSDLETSVNALGKAVKLSPEGHCDKLGYLNNFASGLAMRLEQCRNISDLKACIDAHRKVLDSIPDGDPEKPACLITTRITRKCF